MAATQSAATRETRVRPRSPRRRRICLNAMAMIVGRSPIGSSCAADVVRMYRMLRRIRPTGASDLSAGHYGPSSIGVACSLMARYSGPLRRSRERGGLSTSKLQITGSHSTGMACL